VTANALCITDKKCRVPAPRVLRPPTPSAPARHWDCRQIERQFTAHRFRGAHHFAAYHGTAPKSAADANLRVAQSLARSALAMTDVPCESERAAEFEHSPPGFDYLPLRRCQMTAPRRIKSLAQSPPANASQVAATPKNQFAGDCRQAMVGVCDGRFH